MCAPAMFFSPTPLRSELDLFDKASLDILDALASKNPIKPLIEPHQRAFLIKQAVIDDRFGDDTINQKGLRILAMRNQRSKTTFLGE